MELNQKIYDGYKPFPHIYDYPKSCIGVVICEYEQNQNTYTIFGTGTLILTGIVITSAQNVYSRKSHIKYSNIRFLPGGNNKNSSNGYNVVGVYYPKKYAQMEEGYEQYNFAILRLIDPQIKMRGYIGTKKIPQIKYKNMQIMGYNTKGNSQIFQQYKRNVKYITTHKFIHYPQIDVECKLLAGNPLIVTENNNFYLIGIQNPSFRDQSNLLITSDIINIIREWAKPNQISLDLHSKRLGNNINQLTKYDIDNLNHIDLSKNDIKPAQFAFFKKLNWVSLNYLNLKENKLGHEGCKYLTQINWIWLNNINLQGNNINDQGCKYFKSSNWIELSIINLNNNKITFQGCKFLVQAKWPYLTEMHLGDNKIGTEGCKILKQSNWIYLYQIQLYNNNIGFEGLKFLTQANWMYLMRIFLNKNGILNEGFKYLRDSNWIYLRDISLLDNHSDSQCRKYLKDVKWNGIKFLDLCNSSQRRYFHRNADLVLLKQIWPSAQIN